MKAIILSLLMILTCGNNNRSNGFVIQGGYENVSLISLIANPEKYHDKKIIVKGYIKFENEGEAIYINEDCYKFNLFKNALALNISDSLILEMNIGYGKKGYAEVKGIFNKNRLGHFNSFSGSIGKIEYIDWLEGRKDKTD